MFLWVLHSVLLPLLCQGLGPPSLYSGEQTQPCSLRACRGVLCSGSMFLLSRSQDSFFSFCWHGAHLCDISPCTLAYLHLAWADEVGQWRRLRVSCPHRLWPCRWVPGPGGFTGIPTPSWGPSGGVSWGLTALGPPARWLPANTVSQKESLWAGSSSWFVCCQPLIYVIPFILYIYS